MITILKKDRSLDNSIENDKSYHPSSDSEQSDSDADTKINGTVTKSRGLDEQRCNKESGTGEVSNINEIVLTRKRKRDEGGWKRNKRKLSQLS